MEIADNQAAYVLANAAPVSTRHWTSVRLKIREWLQEQDPGLAELYEGAVEIVFNPKFPGKLRFVGHAVREIRNRLPDSLPNKTPQFTYKKEVDTILNAWPKDRYSLDDNNSEDTRSTDDTDIRISPELFSSIRELLKKHTEVKITNREKAIKFFISCFSSESQDKLNRENLIPIVEQWWSITEWFMSATHHSSKNSNKKGYNNDESQTEILKNFELFEKFLGTLAQNFYDTIAQLDEILKESKIENLEEAIALLIHPQQRIYFFNHLDNPLWIEPLNKKGFFKNPPSVVSNSEERTVSFPSWAESDYLARMAEHDPNTVLKIALNIETDNPRIQDKFVEAALKMPPQTAVQIVPQVKKWIKSPYFSYFTLLPEKIAKLSVYLAKERQIKKSIELARSLLAISENNQKQALLADWMYEKILKKYIPDLITIAGEETLIFLGFLLYDAIKFSLAIESKKNQEHLDIWEDQSIYWRPAIEEYPQNFHSKKLQVILTVAVRDAAEQMVNNDPSQIRQIILLFEKQKWNWLVFHRIKLYLIRKFPNAEPQLVTEALTNPKYFDDSSEKNPEYISLAKEHFAALPLEEKEKILNWIVNHDRDWPWLKDPETKAKYLRRWQFEKLTPLKDGLPQNWQQRYEQLVEEFSFNKFLESSESPKTVSDIASMTDDELISFLKTSQPTNRDIFNFSHEGLSMVLRTAAEKDPERFSLIAEHFQGLNPIYGDGVLGGIRNAINNKQGKEGDFKKISWNSIFQLCSWIVTESQSIQESEEIRSDFIDDWRESRRTVANCLQVGLSVKDHLQIPFDFRDKVWKILQPLTQDRDPTIKDEEIYSSEPSTLSINTVRGKAIHTVIRYALWIRRHFEKIPDGQQYIERGFDEMPEVREVLDFHLDVVQDPSVAIRSIYGQWFPWLVLSDQNWATQNVTKIFPHDESFYSLRDAAWNSYTTFCAVYGNVFEVLKTEYQFEIERINIAKDKRENLTESEEGLVNHLMALYAKGKLILNEPEGILTKFYATAPDGFRSYAIAFLGRSLLNNDTEEAIPSEIIDRLKLLWETRLDEAKRSTQITQYVEELAAFGSWFITGKFDDDWAIEQLKQVLQLIGRVDDFLVVEQLATLADLMPESIFECFKLMIEGDNQALQRYSMLDETKTILKSAIQCNSKTVRDNVAKLIHELGEQGFWQFRELLSSNH